MGKFISYSIALVCSLIVHAGAALLVFGDWESGTHERKIVAPKYIDATLLQLKEEAKPPPKKDNSAAKRREQERLKKLAEQKRRKQAEEKKRKQQQAEKRRAAEKKRKQQELEKKRQQEAARKEREQAERAALENDLLSELNNDLQGQIAENDEQVANSYLAIIQERVSNNWSRPPSARLGMQAEVVIQLVPAGRVVNVRIIKSSGNAAFDRSVEQAVKKAEQFPELKNLEQRVFEKYFRNLPMVFRPEDLRK